MARKPRFAPGGIAYHVMNRTWGSIDLFEDSGDYEAFEGVLAQAMEREPTMRVCCDRARAAYDLSNSARRHADLPGQPVSGNAHRLKELFEQDFARVWVGYLAHSNAPLMVIYDLHFSIQIQHRRVRIASASRPRYNSASRAITV